MAKEVVDDGITAAIVSRSERGVLAVGTGVLNVAQMTKRDNKLEQAVEDGAGPFLDLLWDLRQEFSNVDPQRMYMTSDDMAAAVNYHLGVDWVKGRMVEGAISHAGGQDYFSFDRAVVAHEVFDGLRQGTRETCIERIMDSDGDLLEQVGENDNVSICLRSVARCIVADPNNSELRDIFVDVTRSFLVEKLAGRRPQKKMIGMYLAQMDLSNNGVSIYPNKLIKHRWSKEILLKTLEKIVELNESLDLRSVRGLDMVVVNGFLNGKTNEEVVGDVELYLLEAHGCNSKDEMPKGAGLLVVNKDAVGWWFSVMSGVQPKKPRKKNG